MSSYPSQGYGPCACPQQPAYYPPFPPVSNVGPTGPPGPTGAGATALPAIIPFATGPTPTQGTFGGATIAIPVGFGSNGFLIFDNLTTGVTTLTAVADGFAFVAPPEGVSFNSINLSVRLVIGAIVDDTSWNATLYIAAPGAPLYTVTTAGATVFFPAGTLPLSAPVSANVPIALTLPAGYRVVVILASDASFPEFSFVVASGSVGHIV